MPQFDGQHGEIRGSVPVVTPLNKRPGCCIRPSPIFLLPVLRRSPDEHKIARLHNAAGSQAIQVHATNKTVRVRDCFVISCLLLPLNERGHLLPECVEYGQRHARAASETVADGGRGVEGVGVVLFKPDRRGDIFRSICSPNLWPNSEERIVRVIERSAGCPLY